MRCTDEGEIVSTIRSLISVRANSAHVQVDNERASSSGSSHASLTRCVFTPGGKTRGAPASWCIAQAEQPSLDKPLRPFSYDSSLQAYATTHLRLRDPVSQQQNAPRAHDVPMGHRHRARDVFEHHSLFAVDRYSEWRCLWLFLRRLDLHPLVGSRHSDEEPG
jgi:hypothetical protein